ncbi:hypothetical protein HED60_14060 [Planctomycetales bacterium ZRK34]|nr:hypothetical protein HED60_14060 [Planctomycetales bacterium ZRK34]
MIDPGESALAKCTRYVQATSNQNFFSEKPFSMTALAAEASFCEDRDGYDSHTTLRMAASVMKHIFLTIGSRPPESGGILLGPIGSEDVTDFHFDVTGSCTSSTYSPDCATLSNKMKSEWLPSGIDLKGFVHSHPGGLDRLSPGDLIYIRRLLAINPDMRSFAAPIVLPELFHMRPMVVHRNELHPRTAELILF